MKVSEVINRVRSTAGDSQALQFTDSTVLDWINDGIRECAITNNLLQKRANTNTVVNQTEYTLPSDILKLHSVKVSGSKIKVLTLQEFDEYTGGSGEGVSGDGVVCYVWADKLTLFPTPNTVQSLIIDYIYDPPLHLIANINTDVIGLPVGYHSRIVDYCLAQVAQQDDDMERYAAKMQEFRTGVQSLKDQPEDTYDLYPSISVSSRDAGDGDYYG